MVIKKSMCILAVLVLMFFMIGVVSATTLYIQPSGSSDGNDCTLGSPCTTIQRGVAAASSGDIITVNAGTYNEKLVINKSSITVRSSGGSGSTIINGSIVVDENSSSFILGGSVGHGFYILNDSANFNLSTTPTQMHLVNLSDGLSNVEISHNVFNTSLGPVTAILIGNSSNATVDRYLKNLTVYNNTFYFGNISDEGIVSDGLINVSGLNITQNIFDGAMKSYYASAISISVPDISVLPTIIERNTIKNASQGIAIGNNSKFYGLRCGNSYFKIENNSFYKNNISIDIISADGNTNRSFQNITITNNNFSHSILAAITINASIFNTALASSSLHPSNFTINRNTFWNNNLGINNTFGANYTSSPEVVKAEYNFWGNNTGPGGAGTGSIYGSGAGAGDNVTQLVDYSPWYYYTNLTVGVNIQVRNITFAADYYFSSLKSAIGNASKGDIIEVDAGKYIESNITVDKEVSIIGNGTKQQANFSLPIKSYGFNITADNVRIQNLNISLTHNVSINDSDGDYSQEIFAIHVLGDNVVIDRNLIVTSGNRSIAIMAGAGNLTINSSTLNAVHPIVVNNYTTIDNLTIINNDITIGNIATGIFAKPANTSNVHSGWNISRNIITATKGYTMQLYDLNNSEISYNNLTTSDNLSLGNFVLATVHNNISKIVFTRNVVNLTKIAKSNCIVCFRNLTNHTTTLLEINITHNNITNWGNGTGIWFMNGSTVSSRMLINYNTFSQGYYGNLYTANTNGYALRNDGTSNVNATLNYWGNTTGAGGNSTSGGGAISTYVLYWPYYTNVGLSTVASVAAAAPAAAATSAGKSAAAEVTWKMTYIASEEELEAEEGYTKEMAKKQRVKFKIGEDYHYVGVTDLTTSTVIIQVSSAPQEATLVVGDIRKFDVTEDGFYDLSIVLNLISGSKADITIKKIHEEVTEVSEEEEAAREEEAEKLKEVEEEAAKQKTMWTWIIIGIVVVVLVLVGVGYGVKKKRR